MQKAKVKETPKRREDDTVARKSIEDIDVWYGYPIQRNHKMVIVATAPSAKRISKQAKSSHTAKPVVETTCTRLA